MKTPILCPFLYMHQTVHTLGYITPCCHASPQDDDFWFSTSTADGGLHAPYYTEVREKMQNGEWPDICGICKNKEADGFQSYRSYALENFSTDYKTVKLKYLDIKFSNVCNLACRMCFPFSSSLVEEYYKIHEKPYFLRDEDKYNENIKLHDDKLKIAYVKESILEGLEVLKVTGGEPFASIEFINIIDWCIENNYSRNLELKITTNGTKFNKKLIHKLRQFKKVDISLSIDGTGETYSYIRHMSDWDKLTKNIKDFTKISNETTNITLQVGCVLMFYNLLDFKNLASWCYSNGLVLNVDTYIKPWDNELGVRFLPDDIINIAIEDFKNIKHLQVISNIDDVINFLSNKTSYDKFMCQKLKVTTLMFDKNRNQSYQVLDARLVKFLETLET